MERVVIALLDLIKVQIEAAVALARMQGSETNDPDENALMQARAGGMEDVYHLIDRTIRRLEGRRTYVSSGGEKE